ncbi:hypothetical protein [Roseomonas marmotae]|uniref:Uncharacterized protein n=1 Tax=Roseomonas marmotae TaxID=2768161 RepID=A0ABS3KFT6_9PROT|nr:hypothetical protein [Roseomonas marmotae]MBO1075800.1 hypothetical protein [Roseomonas marmotae]QTI80522.1 hypothetical protein IAI58_07240 [Roseomonas marmotae]
MPSSGVAPAASPEGLDLPSAGLISATRSTAGEVLLTGRAYWSSVPERVTAFSPDGPILPVLWQAEPADSGVTPVLFRVLAPAGIIGHQLALTAFAGGMALPPCPAMPVEAAEAPPCARPALCGIEQDETEGRWRALRGWVLAREPITEIRYSPDGLQWFGAPATPDPDDDPSVHPDYPFRRSTFSLEFPLTGRAEGQDRLLCLASDHAVDLLSGWPLKAGRHFPRPPAFGIRNALQEVLAGLSERMPGLRAIMATDPRLLPELSILPEDAGIARILLPDLGTPRPVEATGAEWIMPSLDPAGIAAELSPVPEPALLQPDIRFLALDGTAMAPAALGHAAEILLGIAKATGLRLAVVVDAPPLEDSMRIVRRLGLPTEAVLLWPQSLLAATPRQIQVLVDPGSLPVPGPVAALALSRRIPVVLWDELAPAGLDRPWPRLPLARILSVPPPDPPTYPAEPYAQLEALLSRSGTGRSSLDTAC